MKKLTETSLCYGQCYGHMIQSTARNIPKKEKQIGLKIYIQTKKTQKKQLIYDKQCELQQGRQV